MNIGRIGWQNANWKKAELFPFPLHQGQILYCRLETHALFLEVYWCGFFLFRHFTGGKNDPYLDMDSTCFSCGILVLWTQQVCSWSPTSQFKQCWSLLLSSFTKQHFCIIFLAFHLPIQCQQCPSFPSSGFFICLLTICQVMMLFQITIIAPSWRIFTYSCKCLLWSGEAVIWNIADVAAGWNGAEKFKRVF